MTRTIVFVITSLITISSYAQKEAMISSEQINQKTPFTGKKAENNLLELGIRIIDSNHLTEEQVEILNTFNFEPYRKNNISSIIRITNGPDLELFSTNRVNTGKVDEVEKNETHNDSDHTSQGHIHPNEVKIRKIEIISLNIFESTNKVKIN